MMHDYENNSIVGNNHIDFENQGAENYIDYKKIMLALQ